MISFRHARSLDTVRCLSWSAIVLLIAAVISIASLVVKSAPRTTEITADSDEPLFASAVKAARETSQRESGNPDVGRVFKEHETVQLDPAQALGRVQQSGTLLLRTGEKTLEIELVPHDMRDPNYKAEEISADGVTRALPRTPVNTFRGQLRGRADTEARFTLDGATVEGLLLIDGEKYFVEPLKRYSKSADGDDFILYRESDVVEHSPASCGATMDEKLKRAADLISSAAPADAATTAPLNRDIKLATEADYEFVNQAGGSSAANSEILSIMNLVDGVFQEELGISFSITYQHTWATPADPYQSTSPGGVFTEFQNYWNSSLADISRDAAHMWTGKDLNGDVIGTADQSVVCRARSRSYGVSQRLDNLDIKIGITAHELGHNLGATHPDQEPSPVSACANSIMQSRVGYSRSFCQFSREQMTAYVNTNAACLSPTYSIAGRVAEASFGSPVTLNLTGPKNRIAPISFTGDYFFRGLTAGTYTLTPSGQFQTFTPASRIVSELNSNQSGIDFTAALVGFNISGRVVDDSGNGIGGVEMILNNPFAVVSRSNTEANGNYVFEGVPATKDYTVSPYSPNGSFTPVSRTLTTLTANQTGVNFTGTLRPTPTPTPTVRFFADTFQFGEGAGHAAVVIKREGDPSGAVTVEYQTVDDPAPVRCDVVNGKSYARCDYATTIDTVTFAAGETQKTVAIPLIDDAHVEGSETFQLRLNGAQGASLGAPSVALLVVLDNDAGPNANPILSAPFFVRMQYLDFLSREPEPDGLAAWLSVLQGCPDPFNTDSDSPSARCDRTIVSSSFFRSEEFQLKGFYVYLFYKAAHGRLPEYAEVIPDMRQVTGQTTAEVFHKRAAFAEGFARRASFTTLYGAMSHQQYVDALLGRYALQQITTEDPQQPDATTQVTLTRQQLVEQLNSGVLTRAKALRALVQSDEVATAEFNGAFVAMQYYGYLRRTPEEGGYQAWLNYLNTHPDDYRAMVNGFMNSAEYRLRFGIPN